MKFIFYFSLLSVILFSCTSQEEPVPQEPLIDSKARLENDYLVFPNQEAFEARIALNKRLSDEEIKTWEASLGFSSMHSFFLQAIEEEGRFYNSITETDLAGLNEVPHSEFVQTNQEYLDFDDFDMIRLNNFRSETASLVNKSGVVKIGNMLYKYSKNEFKSFYLNAEETTAEALNQLYNATSTTVSDIGHLNVAPVKHELSPMNTPSGRTTFDGTCSSGTALFSNVRNLTSTVTLSVTTTINGAINPGGGGTLTVQNLVVYEAEAISRRVIGGIFVVPWRGNINISGDYLFDISPDTFGLYPIQRTYDVTRNDASTFQTTIFSVTTGAGFVIDITDASNQFDVNYPGGQRRLCTINF